MTDASGRSAVFVVTHPGLEPVLSRELEALGVPPGPIVVGGVEVQATLDDVYRSNLALRTASRIVVRVGEFHARTFPELERHARKIPWERFVSPGREVHLRVTAKKSRLNHERAIAERLERALRDRVGDVEFRGQRSDLESEERDVTAPVAVQRFVIRLARDRCTISADSSGPLLHRRGYRTEGGKAPLRETLAAGLLLAAGFDGTDPVVDPLCGAGTIPIEAALIARRMPPGFHRRFAFERWPAFDPAAYDRVRAELSGAVREPVGGAVTGSDRDGGAIEAAARNAERAGVAAGIGWRRCSLSAVEPPGPIGLLATNPPYGARLGDRNALRDLYAQLGHVARRKLPGWRVALLSADRALDRQVGLDWEVLAVTESGGIPVRLLAGTVPRPPD